MEALRKLGLMKMVFCPPLTHPSLNRANRVQLPSLKSLQGQGQSTSNSRVQVCFQPQHPSLIQGVVGAFCYMHPGCSPCVLLVPTGHSTGKLLNMWHSLCPNRRSWTRSTKDSEAGLFGAGRLRDSLQLTSQGRAGHQGSGIYFLISLITTPTWDMEVLCP